MKCYLVFLTTPNKFMTNYKNMWLKFTIDTEFIEVIQ